MKFAFNTSVFRLRPLCESMESIARAGFGAVELMGDRPHAYPDDLKATQITALNQCLENQGIKITNLATMTVSVLGEGYSPSWLSDDWQEREKRIRYTLDCLRLSAALGIFSISISAGGPVPSSMNQREAWRLFVASMHRVLPLAKKLGVMLLIQPSPDLLVARSMDILALLREFQMYDILGVDFDAGHFFCADEDPCQAWEKLKAYSYHVHIEDIPEDRSLRHLPLGMGAMDIPGFLECVRHSGYEGYVTVRLDAYEQGADDAAAASAHYLREKGFFPHKPGK